MKLRNCRKQFGEKSASPILLNGEVYFECPRSIVAGEFGAGYLVSLYFDCKENKTYPFANSILGVTAFCLSLFNFIDGIVDAYKERENNKIKEEQKKQASKSKGTRHGNK